MNLEDLKQGILGVAPSMGNAFKGITGHNPRDAFGEMRKAGQILSANPVGLVISELVFPEPMSDGTLEGFRDRHSKLK
tara:strand:+ start:789 stop:1022 length:234 start_codon:yes stop_codon:yes gene_type:complete